MNSVEELTKREYDVARLLTSSLSNRQIAATLGVSPQTVKRHLASAYSKLALCGRVALALHMARLQAPSSEAPAYLWNKAS